MQLSYADSDKRLRLKMPETHRLFAEPKGTEPLLLTIVAGNHPMFDDLRIDILAKVKVFKKIVVRDDDYYEKIDKELNGYH